MSGWLPSPGVDALAELVDVDLTGLADGDIIQYDSGSGLWLPVTPPTPGSGAFVEIDSQVLGSPASQIDFTGIPADYRDLEILFVARSDRAANDVDSINLRVGNSSIDTGNNYYAGSQSLDDNAGSNLTEEQAASSATISRTGVPGAGNSDSNSFGTGTLHLPNYAGGTVKPFHCSGGFASADTTAGSGFRLTRSAGYWNDTDPITHIRLFAANGDLIAGSYATLYGLGAA